MSGQAESLSLRERVARIIYKLNPAYDSGETIDGFQVSPGGEISWDQACAMDAEFGDDPSYNQLTAEALETADAILAEVRDHYLPPALRETLERATQEEWLGIEGDALLFTKPSQPELSGSMGLLEEEDKVAIVATINHLRAIAEEQP